jgi:hypothetical protein
MVRRRIRKLAPSIRGFEAVNEVARSRNRQRLPRWGLVPRWGLPGAVALTTALAAPLIGALPAHADLTTASTVGSLAASYNSTTNKVVATWTLPSPGFETGLQVMDDIAIVVTRNGVALSDAALGADGLGGTCNAAAVTYATITCQFTPPIAGDYVVTATPYDDIAAGDVQGAASTITANVPTVPNPSGAVTGLTGTANGATVTVTWNPAGVTAWGTGTNQGFAVTVNETAGGAVGLNTCGVDTAGDPVTASRLPKTATGCTFAATTATGTDYSVTVTPISSAGSGTSVQSADIAVGATAPTAAAISGLTMSAPDADTGYVTVSWTAGAAGTFGSAAANTRVVDVAITGGTVTDNNCTTGMLAVASAASACRFKPTSPQTYTATATARTSAGSGPPATTTVSGTVKPSGAVSSLDAVATGANVAVTWNPAGVTSWGAGTNSGFRVDVTGGTVGATTCGTSSVLVATTATGCTFTATAATTYTIRVTATNTGGGDSVTSATDTVATLTAAPLQTVTGLDAVLSNDTVNVTWSVSGGTITGDNPGVDLVITGGTVADNTCATRIAQATTTCHFRPTQAGTYTVTASAATDAGKGTAATKTVAVTAADPTVPTDVSLNAGETSLEVSWTAPEGNSLGISGYVATAAPGDATCSTASADATQCTISGLTPGTEYSVTVVARGSSGTNSDESEPATGTPLGSPVARGPALRNPAGQLQIFARGTGNSVWTSVQDADGEWGGWMNLGGVILGEPIAFRDSDGVMVVLALGTDRMIWQNRQTTPGSTTWTPTGSGAVRSAEIERNADGTVVIIARGSDNAVHVGVQEGAGSSEFTWASLGGVIITDPAINVLGNGRLEILARGTDGNFWHRIQEEANGTTWTDWAMIGASASAMAM